MKKRIICLITASLLLLSSCFEGGQNEPINETEQTEQIEQTDSVYTENGLKLSLREDGTYEVADIGNCTDVDLVIPSHHNGIPITSIYNLAFMKADFIENVTLPDTLTEIGQIAFAICPKVRYKSYNNAKYLGTADNPYEYLIDAVSKEITSVKIHPDTRVIAGCAFMRCNKLTTVMLADGVEYLGFQAFCQSESIQSVYLGKSLKRIERLAFQHCRSLKSIDIPDTVEFIGREAFFNCDLLESVSIPDRVTHIGEEAFAGCDKLASVKLGSSLETIAGAAFRDCILIREITFPKSLKTVCEDAFRGCNRLKKVVAYEGIEEIYASSFDSRLAGNIYSNGKYIGNDENPYLYLVMPYAVTGQELVIHKDAEFIAYGTMALTSAITTLRVDEGSEKYFSAGNCVIERESGKLVCGIRTSLIPDDGSVRSIGYRAFADHPTLSMIAIPSSVSVIGDYAFSNCALLSEVTFSEGLTEIGEYAFDECEKLKSIILPDTLKSVGDRAFHFCEAVEVLDLGSSVESVGMEAFADLEITTLTIPASLKTIGERSFWVCRVLEKITFEGDGKTIGGSAFSGCAEIKSLDLSGVEVIGSYAFHGCFGMTEIKLSDTLRSIGAYAFSSCSKITEIEIPASVTEIGGGAFADCYSLSTIILPETVRVIGDIAFSGTGIESFILPKVRTEITSSDYARCKKMTEFYMHSGVTKIEDGAFYQSDSLKTIYFDGTVAEWDAIEKMNIWYRCTSGITVKCTDGDVSIPKDTTAYEPMW